MHFSFLIQKVVLLDSVVLTAIVLAK